MWKAKTVAQVAGLVYLCFSYSASLAQGTINIGRMDYDITSNGSNSPVVVNVSGAVGILTIPIEISFTTTPNGTQGSNRGGSGVGFQLETGLPLVDQTPVTLSPSFLNRADAVSSTPGAGFDNFTEIGVPFDTADVDPNLDAVEPITGFQEVVVKKPVFTKPNGDQGPELEFAGHFAPVTIATSLIMIDPNTPLGTYDLKVIGLFAKAWDHTPGIQEQPIPWTNDTLQLVIVPEPATSVLVGLFGVMGWRARRRRG